MKRLPSKACAIVTVLLLAVALSGCEVLWNWTQRGALRQDIEDVIALSGVSLNCQQVGMMGTTRDGYAVFEATPEQMDQVRSVLKMRLVETGGAVRMFSYADDLYPVRTQLLTLAQEKPKLVEHYERFQAAYLPSGSEQLKLGSGGRLSYMLFLYDPQAGEVLVLTTYAYG